MRGIAWFAGSPLRLVAASGEPAAPRGPAGTRSRAAPARSGRVPVASPRCCPGSVVDGRVADCCG